MREISATLPALLKEYGDSEEVRTAIIFAVWRQVAGEQLGEHTEPVALEDKRLVIGVMDRKWQRNLETLASEMIYRLNSKLGAQQVNFIEFRIDKNTMSNTCRQRANSIEFETAALDEITEPLRRAADLITDDGLRRSYLLAAGSCLARQKRLAGLD